MTTDDPLAQLCLQVHLDRAPQLDVPRLHEACEAWARRTPGVRGIGVSTGEEDGRFVNIVFATEDPIAAWQALRPAILESVEFGGTLQPASLCLCTGEQGWDDCRVLYHFNRAVDVDGQDSEDAGDDPHGP